MGVYGLSPLLKEVAREVVDRSDGDDGAVLVEGHCPMHKIVETDAYISSVYTRKNCA